ncbi:MAG TPA: PKD domain-containing protein, partial [Armatimonadota bacterium]|nr:PKD domain-containing protein [Armatimonadota bacterium]
EATLTGETDTTNVTTTVKSLTTANGTPIADTVVAVFTKQQPLTLTKFTTDKSSVTLGDSVVLTAESTGGSNVEYQFQIGTLVSAWSAQNTFTWAPDTEGTYTLTVVARSNDTGETVSQSIDGYVVNPPPSPTSISYSVTPSTLGVVGSPVQLSASATGGYNVQYQFQIGTTLSEWSTTNSYTWVPTAAGTYPITVFARSGDSGTPVSQKITDYVVNAPLSKVSLQAVPTSVKAGSTVALTATSIGGGTVEYQFVYTLSGRTTVIRDWGTANVCSWKTSKRGSYTITVYAREKGSSSTVSTSIPYTVK